VGGQGQDSGNVQTPGIGGSISPMAKIAKAITAAVTAGGLVYGSSAILNNPLEQLAAGVAAGIVAGFLVWAVPNAA